MILFEVYLRSSYKLQSQILIVLMFGAQLIIRRASPKLGYIIRSEFCFRAKSCSAASTVLYFL